MLILRVHWQYRLLLTESDPGFSERGSEYREAGGLGGTEAIGCFSNITKIMPNPRFRAYLSKYKEVLSQTWSRGRGGCNPLEDIGYFIS